MIALGTDRGVALRIVQAIQAMLGAIGRAETNAGRPVAPAAEAGAVSLGEADGGFVLTVDLEAARRNRGARTSWVLERLDEMEHSTARVEATLPTDSSSYVRSFGGTRTDPRAYTIPGRGHFRLPGPFNHVVVAVATQHPLSERPRSDLDIGRTMVHELVIHAWRDISYHQRAVGGLGPDNRDPNSQSVHRDAPHAGGGSHGDHNLADYEADLIDYFYDVARGDMPEDQHREYYRAVRDGGRTIVGWQDRSRPERIANQAWREERRRYIDQAELFIRHQQEARASERR